MWLNGRSEAAIEALLPVPIEVRPIRNARRLRLRFDESSGTFKLTCPWRTSRRSALSWALGQRDWIDSQIALAEPSEPFEAGARFPIEGHETRIVWSECARRAPVLADGELRCGGPADGLSRRVENFLKRLALETMSREVSEDAATIGLRARAVSVGDAGSRWGSCSSQGRIRLNWRLILAPPQIRRFVVAHEVAHLRHLDHGPQFKALEAQLFGPGLIEAKAGLKSVGPWIRRIGRRH